MPYDVALIHLSDLEFGRNNRAHASNSGLALPEEDAVLRHAETLAADVRDQLDLRHTDHKRVGLVLTGDISSTGSAEEFALATKFVKHLCQHLELPPGRLAIVPGNHDVCREAVKIALRSKYGSDTISDSDAEKDKKEDFARQCPDKLAAFREFFQGLIPDAEFVANQPLTFPGFLELNVALVGLDTTFPCAHTDEYNFGQVQTPQIEMAGRILRELRKTNTQALAMAAMHHSLIPLNRGADDKSVLNQWETVATALQKQKFELVVCGHEHRRSSFRNIIENIEVLVTGSYGVAWNKLQERYVRTGDMPNTNRYQLLFFRQTNEIRVQYRARDPFAADEKWMDESPPSRSWPLRSRITGGSGNRPNVRLILGEPKNLPSGDIVRCMMVHGSQDDLAKVGEVKYRLFENDKLVVERSPRHDEMFLAEFRMVKQLPYQLEVQIATDDATWTERFEVMA